MVNKDDWKELEVWEDDRKREKIRKYGLDITKEQNTENVEKVSKALNGIWNVVYKVICIMIVVISIYLLGAYIKSFNDLKRMTNIDIIKELEQYHKIDFALESQETDEHGNGMYHLRNVENHNIKFSAIKNGGKFIDDYFDNSLKYCFNNWNSSYKNTFNVEEYTKENGLLSYSLWAEADDFSKIDNILEALSDLKKASGKYFNVGWKIQIKDGEYSGWLFMTGNDESTIESYTKREYVIWHKDNNYNMDKISKDVLDKYYKPQHLKVYINGKIVKASEDNALEPYAYYVMEQDSYNIPLYYIIDNVDIPSEKHNGIQNFRYNGKTYYMQSAKRIPKGTSDEYIIKSGMLYVKDIERIFDTKVKLDLVNRKMEFEIK